MHAYEDMYKQDVHIVAGYPALGCQTSILYHAAQSKSVYKLILSRFLKKDKNITQIKTQQQEYKQSNLVDT